MKKLKNNKGFTLIELLAVIVILAILVAVAVPAVTRYLNTARKGTFASNAQAAISAVRNDVISKSITSPTKYSLDEINELLEKDLEKSPYGNKYSKDSYVSVTFDKEQPIYTICLVDTLVNDKGEETTVVNGLNDVAEADINQDEVKTTGVSKCE